MFNRREIGRVPIVRLAPGQRYEMPLSVSEILKTVNDGKPIPSGTYDVSFATELQLLVGDTPDGWKDYEPIRFPITSSAKGVRNQSGVVR